MENLTGKEAYEAKKQEKESTKAPVRAPRRSMRGALWLPVVLLLLGALGWWFYTLVAAQIPDGKDMSIMVEGLGQEHIPLGSPRPAYNSNPPTSGPHFEVPAHIGFYDVALPDEQLVHNLEHGDIWIAYHPRIGSSTALLLKEFLDGQKVIITPRESNEFDISLAAWERLDLGFNLATPGVLSKDEIDRIRSFFLRYRNKGPESVIDSGAHLK